MLFQNIELKETGAALGIQNIDLYSQNHQFKCENDDLKKELAQARVEVTQVRSQTDAPTFSLPDSAELLNQFRKKLPKSKISLREVEIILELL